MLGHLSGLHRLSKNIRRNYQQFEGPVSPVPTKLMNYLHIPILGKSKRARQLFKTSPSTRPKKEHFEAITAAWGLQCETGNGHLYVFDAVTPTLPRYFSLVCEEEGNKNLALFQICKIIH
jgi:hypothetical protein